MKTLLFLTMVASVSESQVAPPGVKIAFVKNNEIFTSASGSQPRQLTHDGIPKLLPVWSRDGSRIAFIQGTTSKQALSEVVVVDEGGGRINDVLVRPAEKSPPEGMRFVENLEWLSNDSLAVGGSLNPSTTETLVLNLKNGEETNDIYDDNGGPIFSPDGVHVAFLDGMPHFAPAESWRPKLDVDERVVFPTTQTHVTFLTKLRWSPDSKALAFVSQDYDSKRTSLVVLHLPGTVSTIALDMVSSKVTDLFWSGLTLYAISEGRTWELQGTNLSEVPAESTPNPLEQAKVEKSRL